MVRIQTTRFGEIEVSSRSILRMEKGMLGFENCKRYVLLEDKPDTHLKWLQAVDDPQVAFIVVNPMEFVPDYSIELSDDEAELLGLESPEDAVVLTTVTVDQDEKKVTANLLGPIVINSSTLAAKQVVLPDERYGTKHLIGSNTGDGAVLETSRAA
jgi:flagellar assembly factor FliW